MICQTNETLRLKLHTLDSLSFLMIENKFFLMSVLAHCDYLRQKNKQNRQILPRGHFRCLENNRQNIYFCCIMTLPVNENLYTVLYKSLNKVIPKERLAQNVASVSFFSIFHHQTHC